MADVGFIVCELLWELVVFVNVCNKVGKSWMVTLNKECLVVLLIWLAIINLPVPKLFIVSFCERFLLLVSVFIVSFVCSWLKEKSKGTM